MSDSADSAPAAGDAAPLVTVVIPAFNEELTIRSAIDSVLQQTFSDFELLVIDDGSADETARIAASVDDARVRVLTFENQGLAASRNRGIRHAAGKYVAFLDADDLWTADKLQSQVDVLEQDDEVALVYSWTDCIDEQGRYLRHGGRAVAEGNVYELLLAGNFLENGSSPMVRKSAFDAVGLFDESCRAGEDWDMWLRLAYRYPFACTQATHVLYRIRSTSMLSNVERQFEYVSAILQRGLERVPDSSRRERIRRIATAKMYKYLAIRLIETGNARAAGVQAGRYWWAFIRMTPTLLRQLPKAVMIGGAVLLMVLLPPALFVRLRELGIALNYRRARATVPGVR